VEDKNATPRKSLTSSAAMIKREDEETGFRNRFLRGLAKPWFELG
jgi:hypothetical protein